MKRTVGLVVDSTFGLDESYAKEHQILVVPLKVIIDGKEYVDGEIDNNMVIEALKNKRDLKTSQPSPEQFMRAFEQQLTVYEHVLCLTLSKTLSGTFNSANLGLTLVDDPRVKVIDTQSTINGSGYIAEKMVAFYDAGHSFEDGFVYLEELIKKGSLIFTVDNLQTMVKNGRLSRLQGAIGNMLKIKPILRFNLGVLNVEHKVRSFEHIKLYLVHEAKKLLEHGSIVVRIAYVDQSVGAKELLSDIFQLGENVSVDISGVISPVISSHVGLGALGIYLANN